MKAAYIRVSTTGQNLEAQREAVLKAGAEKVFEDKASGKDRNRPQLRACLDFVREGDELLIARLDRFARSSKDLHDMLSELKDKGVTVTFLDNPSMNINSAHGELVVSILGAVASFERKLILARTNEGRESAKRKGVKFGRAPKLTEKTIGHLKQLREGEKLSLEEIAVRTGLSMSTVQRGLRRAA